MLQDNTNQLTNLLQQLIIESGDIFEYYYYKLQLTLITIQSHSSYNKTTNKLIPTKQLKLSKNIIFRKTLENNLNR